MVRIRSAAEVDEYIIEQLGAKYIVDENGCWLWTGLLFSNGYGRLSRHLPVASFSHRAHIASYQLHKGPVPNGLYVCHTCDVKRCINPGHLWLGTNQENQLDAVEKGVFDRYWTQERRDQVGIRCAGAGNPMYGRRGKDAPCYGRTGAKHPMHGKQHTLEAKAKISSSLKRHPRFRKV